MHFSHIVITAFMATMVAAAPKQGKTSVFDLAARDPAVLSIGTSPGCGAYCPTCGDETCTCGSTDAASKAPCCNGYRSSAKNLPGCVSIYYCKAIQSRSFH